LQIVNVIFRPCGRTISATVGYFPPESRGLSIPRLRQRVIIEPSAAHSRWDGYTFLRSTFIPFMTFICLGHNFLDYESQPSLIVIRLVT